MKLSEAQIGQQVEVWGFDSKGACNYSADGEVASISDSGEVDINYTDGSTATVHVSQIKKVRKP